MAQPPAAIASETSPDAIQSGRKTPLDLRNIVLKAYANALRIHLTTESDLSRSGKAIFVSPTLMRGVPIRCQPEYANARLYQLADAIQDIQSPEWGDHGSFANYLREYVDNVQDVNKTEYAKIKAAEERLRAAKREASMQLELATFRYRDFAGQNSAVTFDTWLETHGFDYLDAIEDRALAKESLRTLRSSGSADVKKAKDILLSAIDPSVATSGTSMSCATKDNPEVGSKDTPQKLVIVQRPLYVLDGYEFAGDRWRTDGISDQQSQPYLRINLGQGLSKTWKELGFPDLENDQGRGSRNRQLSKNMDRIRAAMDKFDLVMYYTGFQAFDVSRGLWNIESFRTILPPLAPSAEASLKDPTFKTSKLLLGYNVDLTLRMPPDMFKIVCPDPKSSVTPSKLDWPESEILSAVMDTFPFSHYVDLQAGAVREEGVLHCRRERNELYPQLLAVLARQC